MGEVIDLVRCERCGDAAYWEQISLRPGDERFYVELRGRRYDSRPNREGMQEVRIRRCERCGSPHAVTL